MSKIEKIQAKIDRMLDDICEADGYVQKKDEPRYDALAEVFDFIETLEEEPDESLEEAAEKYQSDARRHVLDNTPIGTAKDAFIAGAKWQEERDEETIKTAEDHAFLAGADWQKQQMLKDAVDADIKLTLHDKTGDLSIHTGYLPKELLKELGIKYGDKVKLIIVKED